MLIPYYHLVKSWSPRGKMIMHRLRVTDIRKKLFMRATYNAINNYLKEKGIETPSRFKIKRKKNSHGKIGYMLEYKKTKSPTTPYSGEVPEWHYVMFRIPSKNVHFKIFPRTVDVFLLNGQEIDTASINLVRELLFVVDYPRFMYQSCVDTKTVPRLLRLYDTIVRSDFMKKALQNDSRMSSATFR